jgi:hypothetical protein
MLPQLLPSIAKELGLPLTTDPTSLVTRKAAVDICAVHETECLGSNRQYDSYEQCLEFIENQRPFGEIWQAGQDTGAYFSMLSNQ